MEPDRRMAFFGKIAADYDFFIDLCTLGTNARFLKKAVKILAPRKGERILDLGSGTGRVASWIFEMVGQEGLVVGMDNADGMVDAAKTRYAYPKNLIFLKQDITRSWSYRNPFDGILASFSIHELPEKGRRRVLEQSILALSDQGRIVVADFNPEISGWKRTLLGVFFNIFERPNLDFLRYGLREELTGVGFKRIKSMPFLGGLLQITLAYKT